MQRGNIKAELMAQYSHVACVRLQPHHVAHRIAGHDLNDDEHDCSRGDQGRHEHADSLREISAAQTPRRQAEQQQRGRA